MWKIASLPLVLLSVALLSGCNSNPSQQGDPANDATHSDPMLQFANGWTSIVIQANFAKTTLDATAHFVTTRNACGKDADGVFDFAYWNQLAKTANLALQGTPLAEARCYPLPGGYTKMDGTADAILDDSGQNKRPLVEVRGDQFCSTISDSSTAVDLFNLITQAVLAADKAECANGWGSG